MGFIREEKRMSKETDKAQPLFSGTTIQMKFQLRMCQPSKLRSRQRARNHGSNTASMLT